jgi:hypothetical protein
MLPEMLGSCEIAPERSITCIGCGKAGRAVQIRLTVGWCKAAGDAVNNATAAAAIEQPRIEVP